MGASAKKKKVVAIIQARMGSTRLPGKVLAPLGRRTVLEWVVRRLQRAELVDRIVVATPDRAIDKPIAGFCRKLGVACFRGSENHVLQRFYLAARRERADIVVRITADCPLIDPAVVDRLVARHLNNRNDYTATDVGGSYPRGMDVEVFNYEALAKAYELATAAHHQEHVTSYLYNNPDLFKLETVKASVNQTLPSARLCVDEPADLELIRQICAHFQPRDDFSLAEIVKFIKQNPSLVKINRQIRQKPAARRYVFRVDGSNKLGLGHITRSLSLAGELAKKGEVLFVYRNDPVVSRLLKAKQFKMRPLADGETMAGELRLYSRDDVLITDSPLIDTGYLKRAKEKVGLLASIYYGGKKIVYPSDILINPNLSGEKVALGKQTAYYAGGKYTLIGGNYRRSGRVGKVRARAARLLVCFGGSDPNEITLRLVKLLKAEAFGSLKILVVAGPSYAGLGRLKKAVRSVKNIVLKSNVPDLSGLLKEADLAVLSGGVLMHEAGALGVPALIVSHNSEQDVEARAFQRLGIVRNLGIHDRVSDEKIARSLTDLIADARARASMSHNARRRLDAGGAQRIAAIIEAGSR